MRQVAELRGLEDAPELAARTQDRRSTAVAERWLYGSTRWCGFCDQPAVTVIANVGVCEVHNNRAQRIGETAR
jgi:hypothetical protein